MSKPISISFGKPKSTPSSKSTNNALPVSRKPASLKVPSTLKSALRPDSDDEEEIRAPVHESVLGFASDGVILSQPVKEREELVIKNAGNGDWRRRGRRKNLLPADVQRQREAETNRGGDVAMVVEKDEVSQASGLQFAESASKKQEDGGQNGVRVDTEASTTEPVGEQTEDEVALQALLRDGTGESRSNAVIMQNENATTRPVVDETEDFRADVASRPDSCTLEEYAAMPVEEFGLALLRGMGAKRRANGEIISYRNNQTNGSAPKVREPTQGYLGIGAKAVPGREIELGAWGKADMRRNKKGEGLYTPVMLRDKRTGEMLTEGELEARKKEARAGQKEKGEEDWRDRRDRNLEKSGRDGEQKRLIGKDDYRDQMNGFSRITSSGRERDGYDSPRNGYSSRERSRSRDRRRHDSDRDRDRKRDKHRDDDRYDSSSSRKSSHRDRDRGRSDKDDDYRRRERH